MGVDAHWWDPARFGVNSTGHINFNPSDPDETETPSPPGGAYLRVYFINPYDGSPLDNLNVSYVPVQDVINWTLCVDFLNWEGASKNVTISWDPEEISAVPANYVLQLYPLSPLETVPINMREVSSYTFQTMSFGTFFISKYTFNITATTAPSPDLLIEEIIFNVTSPFVGDPVNITATIYNAGSANAASAEILFYDGDPYAEGILIGNETITDVPFGSSKNVSTVWTATSGEHNIYVLITKSSPGESDIANNLAYASIFVTEFGVELQCDDATKNLLAGASVNYTIIIINRGNVHDTFALSYSTPPEGWTAFLSESLVELDPGLHANVTLTVSAPIDAEVGATAEIWVNASSMQAEEAGLLISDSIKTTTTVAEDAEPPTAPANLVVSPKPYSRGEVYLSWDAASDNVGVEHYNIYRNDALIGTSTSTSYVDVFPRNGSMDGHYIYYVTAVDYAGNEGPQSNTDETTVDTVVNVPAQPDRLPYWMNQTYIFLNWTSNPGSDSISGVANYTLYKSTDGYVYEVLAEGLTVTWFNDTDLPEGRYFYILETFDYAGNVANSTVVSTILSTKPLIFEVWSSKPSYAPSENVTLYAYFNVAGEPISNATVTFEVRDPSSNIFAIWTNKTDTDGIAIFEFKLPPPNNVTGGIYTVNATVHHPDIGNFTASTSFIVAIPELKIWFEYPMGLPANATYITIVGMIEHGMLHIENTGEQTALNVIVTIEAPTEISVSNYSITFDKMEAGEHISIPLSFTARSPGIFILNGTVDYSDAGSNMYNRENFMILRSAYSKDYPAYIDEVESSISGNMLIVNVKISNVAPWNLTMATALQVLLSDGTPITPDLNLSVFVPSATDANEGLVNISLTADLTEGPSAEWVKFEVILMNNLPKYGGYSVDFVEFTVNVP